jgi:hypothetical protein
MHSLVLPSVLVLSFCATAFAGEVPTVYGAGVEEGATITPAQLMADPDRYVDQVVRVAGSVTDVCPMAGCWILLQGDDGPEVRVKVKDGEIVFPKELKEHGVVAQGVFRKYTLTREQALASAAHEAEERGLPFDPATAEVSTTMYQIEGTGAVVR